MNLKEQFDLEKLHIHMFYWIVILVLTIIVLFTTRGYSNESLAEQVAFGATLSGIILSVIAIIMTLIGESKSDNTKDKLVSLSEDLEKIVGEIKNTTANLEIALKSNCEMKEGITKISSSMEQLISFPKAFSSDEKYVDKKDVDEDVSEYYLNVFKNLIYDRNDTFKKHIFIILVYTNLKVNYTSELSFKTYTEDLINLKYFKTEQDSVLRTFWGILFTFKCKITSRNCFSEYIEENLKENYREDYDKIVNYLANS